MATVDQVDAVVVVDPYSSGRFLLYELKARGIPIICVRSCLSLGSFFLRVYDTHRDYFAVTIDFQEEAGSDLQQLVDRLVSLPYRVLAVFGGCEPGVELAERLAEALALPTANGTELLLARKDKAEMQNCLRLNGVPAAEQHKSGILEELLSWARARGQWPLVAKPLSSSGSDGIFFCQNEEDLESAHKVIVGALNPNGVQNTDIALQEFLTGDEYIVDSVSRDGRHQCVAIWVYSKRRGLPWNATAILSEGNTLLPAEGAIQDVLVDYVFKVLDAVGLRFGPCHTEVMLTPRGPILVEVNCRLHGLQGPRLIELATGTSKATAAADVLLGGELFEKNWVPPPGRYLYPLHRHCVQMVLISPVEGFLTEPIQDTILAMNLASVVEILPALQKGGYLRQSIDLNSSAGTLLMVHSSKEQLEADIAQIRAAEESGLLYPVSRSRLPSSPMASPRGFGTDAAQCSSPRMQSMENSQQIWAAEMDVLDALPEAADFQLSGLS
eukprot:CAMPEP_0115054878 /NCGR_PEP_ID=MMETSP0227-20121206/4340_1 /TAXON_ID=89957 /ORGANISM="Polarella glacialis, Strain CCMP 1383" /LENGTH=497 /DNA_ID=CAMNT_0002439405 /DNA_START=36 /DNA_END=1529 /DNA_ORIENTATION=+